MKLIINPIIKKDIRVSSRSMKLSWGFFAYESVLAMALFLALLIIQNEITSSYNNSNIYSLLIVIFPVLAISQTCIVTLIMPIITSSSISGEKERQTFDIMATSCMSPFSIVLGKVGSAIARILLYVTGSIPIMAISFIVGGMKWNILFFFLLSILLLSIFSGSIGIMCSAFSRKSISAVIMSFIIYFIIFVLTFLPFYLTAMATDAQYFGESLLLLLINPIVFFEEFFMTILNGNSLLTELNGYNISNKGTITFSIINHSLWITISSICILLLSFVFLLIASWKVNPLHSGSKRKKVKKTRS